MLCAYFKMIQIASLSSGLHYELTCNVATQCHLTRFMPSYAISCESNVISLEIHFVVDPDKFKL